MDASLRIGLQPFKASAVAQPVAGGEAVGIRWDLSDLFGSVDDPAIDVALGSAKREAEEFAMRFRGTIAVAGGPSVAHLGEGVRCLENLTDLLSRLGGYAHLQYDEDTRDVRARGLSQRIEEELTAIRNLVLFFDLEWMEVDDVVAQALIEAPQLSSYRHFLSVQRSFRHHRLTEAEERLTNEKDVTGSVAWARLHTEVTSSMSFEVVVGNDTRVLNMTQTLALLHDGDRQVRQAGHDALYTGLERQGAVLTYAYDTLIQDKRTMDRLRGYRDPMASRHLGNEIPPAAVEAMMQAVESSYPMAQSYFRLKASLLGLTEMRIYDQYAPLDAVATTIPWEHARKLVTESYRAVDATYGAIAAACFEQNWIDAEPRDGKRGGAYCAYPSPGLHPWILCNYTGTPRDVMTVAHELGHGLHAVLANRQSLFNYHSTLPLAETASIFGEMVVFERLVAAESDPRARLGLIAGRIEDTFATVFRQNVLTRFESLVHAERANGRLTAEQIGDHWIAANSAYYGDSIALSSGYRWGWSYIPHFIHTPFYCYAYVFGQLLVLALYRMYREEGSSFIPKFTELLARGGSDTPSSLLEPLGVDITDPRFWEKGLRELEVLITQATSIATALRTSP